MKTARVPRVLGPNDVRVVDRGDYFVFRVPPQAVGEEASRAIARYINGLDYRSKYHARLAEAWCISSEFADPVIDMLEAALGRKPLIED